MKKRNIIIICFGIVVLAICIFAIFRIMNYKNTKMGNNISDKTLQEIESFVLNISSYEAKIELEVESNKNSNKYIINQKFCSPNLIKQEVIEPKNIEGLTIKYDGTNMEISNTKLNLKTIYQDYEYIADNTLWLSDFIECYKNNNGTITENNGVIVMEVKCDKNKYLVNEKLYIDRNANKITQLIVEDENKKAKIYITYKEVEINSLNKENVLVFKNQNVEKFDI